MRPLLATLTAFFLLSAPASAAWTWPVAGDVITPYRNGTDAYARGQHRGIDIAAAAGSPVVAAAGGEVRFAGTAGSSGLTVSVRTGDGYDTSYLHLSALAVRAGARVEAGDRIGAVGTTGTRSATAPHLHFGVRDAGTRHAYHDPMSFLPPPPAAPRAPEAPPGTAPAPAPVPPQATPAPVTAPHHAPRTTLRPVPRALPRPAPHRAARAAPRPAPRALRAEVVGHGGLRSALDRGAAPAVAGRHAHNARPGGDAVPRRLGTTAPHGPSADPHRPLDASGRSIPVPTAERATDQPGGAGSNLPWALACAGLLLAAGVLGLTESRRRACPTSRRTQPRPARRPRVASIIHAVLRHDAHLLRQR